MPFSPNKADPPLVIDADTVLPFSVTFERLQSIRRWKPQIFQLEGGINRIKLHEGPLLNVSRELPNELTLKDSLSR